MDKMKLNIPMFAALILLLLTMITTHITSGLFARYTTQGSGSDSARVAEFDVSSLLTAYANENGKFKLTVTSNSEVAVQYKIVVEFDAPMSVALDGGEPRTRPEQKKSVTFTNDAWVFAPGSASSEHTLQFAMTDWSYITGTVTNQAEVTQTLSFNVNVVAEQVD